MALKTLDQEFELKPGTQLLPYMKRLLPSLEARFQALEKERKTYSEAVEDVRAVALKRINEILIPATEAITQVTTLGFLLGPSGSSVKLELGIKTFIIDEGAQRASFTPSPYVLVERRANITDYAIARVTSYDQETGILVLDITAWHGNQGPWTDWVISSTPGMADSTKIYHDEVGPWRDEVEADKNQVMVARDEVIAAANALNNAGLDAQNFVRRDGAVPFVALQAGVHPVAGANDTYLATTAWARARMIEYTTAKVNRAGDTMGGPLTLSADPVNALHACTKQYVDSRATQGGIRYGDMTINSVNAMLTLQPTGPGQFRQIIGVTAAGVRRWQIVLGDGAAETGGGVGSDFYLYRYNDAGGNVGAPISVSRQTGTVYTGPLGVSGSASIGGDLSVVGDIHTYRPNATNTGVVWFNQANSAYLYFDGGAYNLAGGYRLNAADIGCGGVTCTNINTQGNNITTGSLTVNNVLTCYGGVNTNPINCNSIQLNGGNINGAGNVYANGAFISYGGDSNIKNLYCLNINTQGYNISCGNLATSNGCNVQGGQMLFYGNILSYGINTQGYGVSCGSINNSGGSTLTGTIWCNDIYSATINTQGRGIYCGGLSNSGNADISGNINAGGLVVNASGSSYVRLNHSGWGNAYIYHSSGNIGFLNNSGSWCFQVNQQGNIWSPAYGWIHDYVGGTVNNAVASKAPINSPTFSGQPTAPTPGWGSNDGSIPNTYWTQGTINNAVAAIQKGVINMRLAYAGDQNVNYATTTEPFGGAVMTSFTNNSNVRYRYVQFFIDGQTWYTANYT